MKNTKKLRLNLTLQSNIANVVHNIAKVKKVTCKKPLIYKEKTPFQ